MSQGLNKFHSRYVYRVLRPDEDSARDLTCSDSSSKRSLAEHVETGLRIPSKYISTTSSLEMAKKWLEKADENTSRKYRNERNTIVKIDVARIKSNYPNIANSAIDLTNGVNREHFLENEKQKSFAAAYQEVVFQKYIPSDVVSVVHIKGMGHIENPQPIVARNYRYDSSDDEYGNSASTFDAPTYRSSSSFNRIRSQESYTPRISSYTSQATYPSYQSRSSNSNAGEEFVGILLGIIGIFLCIIWYLPSCCCIFLSCFPLCCCLALIQVCCLDENSSKRSNSQRYY